MNADKWSYESIVKYSIYHQRDHLFENVKIINNIKFILNINIAINYIK